MQVVSLRVGGRALRVSDAADAVEAPATLPQASLSVAAAASSRSSAPRQPTLRKASAKHAAVATAHTVATGGTVGLDDRRRMRRERRQEAVIGASENVATVLSHPSADTGGKARSVTPVRGYESVASSGASKAKKPNNTKDRPAGNDTVTYFLKAAAAEPLLTHDEEVALALHLREQQVTAVISCNRFVPHGAAAV